MSDPPPRKNPRRSRAAPVRYEDEPLTKEPRRRGNRNRRYRDGDSDSGDEGGHFVVEKILESRRTGFVYEFKIKWAGFPEAEATWEPERSLRNCQNMLDLYEYDEAMRIGPTKELEKVLGATKQPGALHYRILFTDGTVELVKHTSALAWYEEQMIDFFKASTTREPSDRRYKN